MIDIAHIDDATAERILKTIAHARAGASPADSAEARRALADEFKITPAPAVPAGELARLALQVLAEDPETRAAIESMAAEEDSGRKSSYDGGASIAIAAAAYFALSTGLDLSRDKQGKWSFKMKVKPAGEAAVKKLVEKLVGYLPG